ncbi:uncharacterized protein VTP21DRAFT_5503 [Calcarisporiella thermophila]|uniref:uncharacterized protein n=1 Tax=Calcarisporiella thermophila TaxID=911321 RepID=UPI0037443357
MHPYTNNICVIQQQQQQEILAPCRVWLGRLHTHPTRTCYAIYMYGLVMGITGARLNVARVSPPTAKIPC